MSAPQFIVYTPLGPTHLRADTCEALGIQRGERIGTKLWQDAVVEDHRRNREDRRRA